MSSILFYEQCVNVPQGASRMLSYYDVIMCVCVSLECQMMIFNIEITSIIVDVSAVIMYVHGAMYVLTVYFKLAFTCYFILLLLLSLFRTPDTSAELNTITVVYLH